MHFLAKRLICLLLVLGMLCGMMPITVLATENEEAEENPWSGRSAVFVGDSITAGSGTTKIYYSFLEEALGFDSVTAMGVGGSCISAYSDYGTGNQPLINRYQTIPSADLIVIFMGTNDYGHETPLGSMEDTQDGTFYGALNTIIPTLVAKHTSSKIVFVTPLHRYGFGTSKILGTQFTYDNIPNGVGATLGDYVDALKTVCAKNGVSVIDLHTECTLDPSDAGVRAEYMPDGLHPNAAGHEVIAGIMESHIRGYEPVESDPVVQTEMIHGNKFAAGNNQFCRASSRINYYLKAGTVITLKDPAVMQWACAKTSNENSSSNLGYFPDSGWSDKETAVVAEDGWIGFTFKYRDETRSFDLTKPLSDYITIHTHSYNSTVTVPTCMEQGYTTYTCTCGDSYADDYVDATGEHSYENGTCTGCGEVTPTPAGKTISILGASMSTYTGVSNNPDYNSTIGNNAVYYTEGKLGVYKNDTWWMQVADDLGLELLVNNSWSGSSLLHERNGTVGAYVDRCVQLHNNEGEMPDIIAIQMGTNDFQYYKDTLGTADIDYAALITENEDGSFTYAEPTTSLEAAAIVLHKISIRYPNAEVYYLNISQRIDGTDELIRSFNAELKQVVEHFGAHIVDIYGSAITMADFDTYIGDGRVHPNCLGMDAYTEAFKRALLANTAYEVDTHTVSLGLDGVTADYGDDKIVVSGDAFSCTLTAEDGKELSVSVTMGGEDITDTAYENGTVSIESVTDDVVITAEATVHQSQNYRWEFDGTDLSCVGGGNTLTKNSGTTTDGVFSKTSYTLENEVVLMHDLPWIVEWKCEGTFLNTNGSSGARIFTSDNVNANYNARYIFKSNTNGIIAMGEKDTKGSHNYGIALADYGIDWTTLHTYRLENRIADDGSNMVWLLVDGEEIGPMNHYYIGTKDQNTTSDWLSGKDFVFPYMGTDTHGFTNASIDCIQVWEGGHSHIYENGICIGCDAEHPNLDNYKGKVISILGDSISTFAGYIPIADGFNLQHRPRYPQSNLFSDVNLTWWMQTITALDAKLGINDSWAGSTVTNTITGNSGDLGEKAAMASLTRIQNLGANGTPDVILFYGGTNDIGRLLPLGSFDPATAPTEVDLTTTKWTTVADAYVDAIMRLQYYYPEAEILAMLPTYTASYYTNAKLAQYNTVFSAICEHYGIPYIDLRDCGISTANLPDGIHPDATGMDYITRAVLDTLLNDMKMEAGEHIVHSVTHNLNGAESSLGYYKGVTHGKSFVTTITGENVTVSVTMGGADVTDAVYANGVVSVAEVTGDIVITAKGRVKPIYEDHLQQLPENLCCSTNLWSSLVSENTYYTGSAWGNVSGNSVYSITIPVAAGDQIWATSFQKSGTNGGSRNGIRLSWFDENGVLESVSPDDVYAEFAANAFVTAPDGAVAVNVVMWNGKESNEVYLLNRDHTYENGICTGCGVNEWDTDGDGVLEILAIGNSFSVDALEYAYQIAQDLGIEEVAIGNLYIGGCTLETHAKNAAGDLGKYTYYYNDNGTWTSTGSYKISTALESRTWDYVSMQQGSPVSGVESSYNDDLADLIAYVQARSDAKLVWHMTWAYQQNSTHSAFPTYGKDQMTMYNAIVSAVQNKIVTNSNFDLIVPNGTAVQNSRTSLLGDTTTRDGYHMSYDYGRYLTGLLFVKTLTGLDISNVTYAPSGVDAEEKAIAIESANNAAAKPFEVTQSAYVKEEPELPDEGYILLKPELHKGAYWNATDKTRYNVLIADADNSKYFFATDRFTKEELPVGSIIVLESGWQYRPDGWITDTVQSSRADTTTESYVVVTEEWWGNYTIRGFNISKVGTPSIMNLSAEDIYKVFRIYVPEEKHSHDYTFVVAAPTCTEQGYTTHTCTLCGDSYVDDYMDATGHSFENGFCAVCGEIHYIELQPELFQGAFWYPINADRYNELVYDMSNSYQYYATIRFTRETLPVGSIIVLKDGWQYRPDGWITDAVQTGTRAPVTTGSYVEVTEAWWGDYTIRGFNISKVGLPSMMDVSEEEVRAAFQILVPENSHIHNNENGICSLCGEIMGPVITQQPVNGEAKMGERYMVEVKAEGEGLKYQWYFRNAGSNTWYKSGVRDNTYDDVMTTARAGREVYCVITDANGNSVTTDTAKLICTPSEKLEIVTQPTDGEAILGERYCVTVEAKGDNLKYQWYFRNAGSEKWYRSSVRDNTYDDVMTTARAGREVYCVITDACGNSVTTIVVKLVRVPVKLEITTQPTDATATFGEMFCATVEAKGEKLKYQWYFRNAGSNTWYKSGVRDNTYDDVMTKARNGREVYCVITDTYGNTVTTDVVKLMAVPSVELKLLGQSYESAAMGERYCVTVDAQGDGLKYQWYFRNAGSGKWYKSGVRDNTYDDVMTKARANREVYCVITDAFGSQIVTDAVTLTPKK